MNDAPQYCTDLYKYLSTEYSVQYYTETDGEYAIVDCFIVSGYCIKLDRVDVDVLSSDEFEILVQAVKETLEQLKKEWKELGH